MEEHKLSALEQWVVKVSEEEMPTISLSAKKIADAAQDDNCSIEKLASLILQDAVMTMHILRLTDSAYHIPRKNRQNTISRAIITLGVDEVRSICLSIAIIKPLLSRQSNAKLAKFLAHAFHAAVQARFLAAVNGDVAAEEIFIAALLLELGEMVFWGFGAEEAGLLEQELLRSELSKEEAEIKVLGFELRKLTAALAQKWGLGRLLLEALEQSDAKTSRSRLVALSHRIAQTVEGGWESNETRELISEISRLCSLPQEVIELSIRHNTAEAATVAEDFEAFEIGDQLSSLLSINDCAAKDEDLVPPCILEPDPNFKLKVLQDVNRMIQDNSEIVEILELILQGIYLGLGMDRTIIALLSPNHKYLRAKTSLGHGKELLNQHFRFEINTRLPTVFDQVINEKKSFWVPERTGDELDFKIPKVVEGLTANSPFFVAPLISENEVIGILFADRKPTQRALNAESYNGFKQFALRASQALEKKGSHPCKIRSGKNFYTPHR